MRVIDFFDRGADRYPKRAALVSAGKTLSYAEAQRATVRIAAAIAARGDEEAPNVAVYSPNDVDAFLCVLGAMRAGAVWVPINARNAIDENIYILVNSDCRWLFYHSSFAPEVARIREEAPGIRHFVCIDGGDRDAPSLGQLVAAAPDEAPRPPTDPHRLASILSTGGTTGRPKGVIWSNLTWETLVANFWVHMPCDEPPVYLVAAPMTHAAGIIAPPLMAAGATTVVLEKADPELIMQAIERHRVTHLFLPPTVIYMMLAHQEVRRYDYASLRYFIYSAAPMAPDKLREAMTVFGPVMAQAYGQAEVPLMGTFLSPADHVDIARSGDDRRFLSCGRATMLNRVEVVDDDDRVLEPGAYGEIVMQGNLVMPGYYNLAEETARVSRSGWHHTGDIGFKDEDGFVYIVDRKKDMIITGGFNVYSTEVEKVILSHPAVQDCAVIGVPDEKWGEAVKAVIEPKPGTTVAVEDIRALCRDRLGGVKTPKSVDIIDALPRSPVGKVLKRALRDRYWRGRDRRV